LYYLKEEDSVTHFLYDKIIFKKIKALLGGNVRFMVTGGAPLGDSVLDFLQIAFCAPMNTGYGMSETTSSGT
jgi:long-chain acyl-CoA synthetase